MPLTLSLPLIHQALLRYRHCDAWQRSACRSEARRSSASAVHQQEMNQGAKVVIIHFLFVIHRPKPKPGGQGSTSESGKRRMRS
ncbi:hypothetical protein CALCODRAFT_81364 [Calocera cornea HHB12733]|uniref:Uncharacterized protein n=1 Tax=Calocera cornea HHB12733 TaxID=1353952 RepID=A0A165DEP1_9BASI|nr:hypothetical protein CALCODRAFT_81364 [Calocera cornea HHB12733]